MYFTREQLVFNQVQLAALQASFILTLSKALRVPLRWKWQREKYLQLNNQKYQHASDQDSSYATAETHTSICGCQIYSPSLSAVKHLQRSCMHSCAISASTSGIS